MAATEEHIYIRSLNWTIRKLFLRLLQLITLQVLTTLTLLPLSAPNCKKTENTLLGQSFHTFLSETDRWRLNLLLFLLLLLSSFYWATETLSPFKEAYDLFILHYDGQHSNIIVSPFSMIFSTTSVKMISTDIFTFTGCFSKQINARQVQGIAQWGREDILFVETKSWMFVFTP